MKYSLVINIISLCIASQITRLECINTLHLIKYQVHKYFINYFLCFVAWVFVNILE